MLQWSHTPINIANINRVVMLYSNIHLMISSGIGGWSYWTMQSRVHSPRQIPKAEIYSVVLQFLLGRTLPSSVYQRLQTDHFTRNGNYICHPFFYYTNILMLLIPVHQQTFHTIKTINTLMLKLYIYIYFLHIICHKSDIFAITCTIHLFGLKNNYCKLPPLRLNWKTARLF